MPGLVKLFKLDCVSTVAAVYVLEFVPFEVLAILVTVTLFKDEVFTSYVLETFVLFFEEIVAFASVLSLLFFCRDKVITEVLYNDIEGVGGIEGIEGIEDTDGIDGVDGVEGIGEICSMIVDLELSLTCWGFNELVTFSSVELFALFSFFSEISVLLIVVLDIFFSFFSAGTFMLGDDWFLVASLSPLTMFYTLEEFKLIWLLFLLYLFGPKLAFLALSKYKESPMDTHEFEREFQI